MGDSDLSPVSYNKNGVRFWLAGKTSKTKDI